MPTALDVIPATHRDLLTTKGFAHLASLGPGGEPQSHPVWYDFDGDRIRISTTRDRQKYRNVTRDPRVALSILDPDDAYRYLEVRGVVDDVADDPDYAFIDSLARKYLGKERYPERSGERVILSIRPEHATTMG